MTSLLNYVNQLEFQRLCHIICIRFIFLLHFCNFLLCLINLFEFFFLFRFWGSNLIFWVIQISIPNNSFCCIWKLGYMWLCSCPIYIILHIFFLWILLQATYSYTNILFLFTNKFSTNWIIFLVIEVNTNDIFNLFENILNKYLQIKAG